MKRKAKKAKKIKTAKRGQMMTLGGHNLPGVKSSKSPTGRPSKIVARREEL